MKRITYITTILAAGLLLSVTSCKDKRVPGKIYMPDMAYSRAIETYAELDSAVFTNNPARLGQEIFYTRMPVTGTVKRGELFDYTIPNDSIGYIQSAAVKNPLPPLSSVEMLEASRLYNINCGICHGAKGKADGPIATSGKLGGIVDLTSSTIVAKADGTMFHSITYGLNNMGSYASQLDRKQRWMIIQYVRTLQGGAAPAAAADSAAVAAK
jgi:hypothetical protein